MINQTFKRGFTLIELLVVIAIIGILASVVLASLTTARTKGTNAAVQSSVSNVRAQAEIYGSRTNGSVNYDGWCANATVNQIEADIVAKTTYTPECNQSSAAGATASGWAFQAQLAGGTEYLCVDSSGISTTTTTDRLATATDVGC
jgi:prepilin-type N-terminal cleavage/methylation domain-containing protein